MSTPLNGDPFVSMILSGWDLQLGRFNTMLASLTDQQLSGSVAPNRNTGHYLLGHLVAVHDGMFPILGFGPRHYPEYEAMFLSNPDKPGAAYPTISDLRDQWMEINKQLSIMFRELTPQEWMDRHTAVTPEVFAKEPHRNKLNILVNRSNHLSYHMGQMVFLK